METQVRKSTRNLTMPNVGYLMELCERNYSRLMILAPCLRTMQGQSSSRLPGSQDLYLEILEQSPYTSIIHLTHRFPGKQGSEHDPDAVLRVYHDARQVEVIDLKQDILPVAPNYHHPALQDKWKASLFLSKWLDFCVKQGHGFYGASADKTVLATS
ncbi:MAG: DUF1249 domain-containing protein [bacterium]